jgi:hypothetical protein
MVLFLPVELDGCWRTIEDGTARDLSADCGRAENGGEFFVIGHQGIKKPVNPGDE